MDYAPPPSPVLLPRGVLIDPIYRYLIYTVFDKTVSIGLSWIDTIIDTHRFRHSWLCSSSITHDLTNCSGNKNYTLFQFPCSYCIFPLSVVFPSVIRVLRRLTGQNRSGKKTGLYRLKPNSINRFFGYTGRFLTSLVTMRSRRDVAVAGQAG